MFSEILGKIYKSFNISKLAINVDADLVHAHFAYSEGFLVALSKRTTNKPFVITVHGSDVQTDPSIGYGDRLSKPKNDAIRKTLSEADKVFAVSESLRDEAIRIIGDKADKILYIPNAINPKRFNIHIEGFTIRKRLGIRDDQCVILCIRHHRPVYGVEYLIDAAAIISKQHPNTLFIMGGDGPLHENFKEHAAKLGLNNLLFVGIIARGEVPSFIAACNIYCDPCLFGQGISTLEAMACGKPVVGFRSGQIKIIDEQTGFLVELKDTAALANRISFLIENPNIREKMGFAGIELINQNYSNKKKIDTLIEIYNNIKSARPTKT